MERYDGKTRKDDYKKYALIALGVAVLMAAWFLALHFFGKKDAEPDYRLVFAAETLLDEQSQEAIEEFVGEVVGDTNGDGETIVELTCIAIDPLDYANSTSAFLELGTLLGEEDVNLCLFTDEPVHTSTVDFDGISSNYCGQEDYFIELPSNLADEAFANRAQLNSSVLFTYLGFEDEPLIYASICSRDDEEAEQQALEIIQKFFSGKQYHFSLS